MGEQWWWEVIVVLLVLVSCPNSTTPNQLVMQDSRINGWNIRVSSAPWGWSWQMQKHHPESKGYEVTHDMKSGFDCLLWHKRLGPCNVFFVPLETPSAHSPYPRPEMKPNQTFCYVCRKIDSMIPLTGTKEQVVSALWQTTWDIKACEDLFSDTPSYTQKIPLFWECVGFIIMDYVIPALSSAPSSIWNPLETWLSMTHIVSYQGSNLITYHVNPLTSPVTLSR
jgi:hypothetical protein